MTSYHSALEEPEEAPACRRVKFGGSVAFAHNLARKGPPRELASCDIIYTEIAWQAGYQRFAARSGIVETFEQYLAAVAALTRLGPCIVVCGKREAKRLPEPRSITPVNLNTGGRFLATAVALAYGRTLPAVQARHRDWTYLDTENLLHALAERHERVGDPCCGYGNTGRIFAEHGKAFVLSDADQRCIGHIKQHAKEWWPHD